MQRAVDRLVQLLLPGVTKSLDGVCRRSRPDTESVRRVVECCVLEVIKLGNLRGEVLYELVERLRRGETQGTFLINVLDAVGACIFAELEKMGSC
jgi:hypothetical protein